MELRHLRYFVAVADELSFRGAARRLHVAQPSLGRQIRDLEEEIGERLFDRDRRQVSLTDSGRVLLGEAQAILAAAEHALHATREAARGDRGLLRIGNISRLSSSFLSRGLHAFRELYPRVEIELVELAGDEQVEALRRGAIEVGFQPVDRDAALDAELSAQPILQSPVVALLPANHPLAAQRSVSLASLSLDRFLRFQSRPNSGYERFVGNLCREFGGFAVRFTGLTVEGAETAFGLVAAGRGVVLLPQMVVRKPRKGDGWIVRRLLAPVPQFELSAVWRTANPSLIVKNYLRVLDRDAA
jgi:DNA-binding transcriptional LysR family regulator